MFPDAFNSCWMTRVQFLAAAIVGVFFLPPSPDKPGGQPSLPTSGYQGLTPAVKQLGSEAHHSPPSSAKVKNEWSFTSTPQYVFMA